MIEINILVSFMHFVLHLFAKSAFVSSKRDSGKGATSRLMVDWYWANGKALFLIFIDLPYVDIGASDWMLSANVYGNANVLYFNMLQRKMVF